MSDFGWDEMDPALEGPGVAIRRRDNDGLAQALIRLDAGLRTDPLFAGLPHDQCQCAHWGYIISGTMRVDTADGHADYEAGRLYYWAPGHNLEAITDTEYVEFTRSEEYDQLMAHCHRVMVPLADWTRTVCLMCLAGTRPHCTPRVPVMGLPDLGR